MVLKKLPYNLTVCKLNKLEKANLNAEFYFIGRTDEEISLVCRTADTPSETIERDDGWKGFRIIGQMDFSLIGILARISKILAETGIGIFAISTYNTDYILTKEENFKKAMKVLKNAGYEVRELSSESSSLRPSRCGWTRIHLSVRSCRSSRTVQKS